MWLYLEEDLNRWLSKTEIIMVAVIRSAKRRLWQSHTALTSWEHREKLPSMLPKPWSQNSTSRIVRKISLLLKSPILWNFVIVTRAKWLRGYHCGRLQISFPPQTPIWIVPSDTKLGPVIYPDIKARKEGTGSHRMTLNQSLESGCSEPLLQEDW